jgi:hypothetical protein
MPKTIIHLVYLLFFDRGKYLDLNSGPPPLESLALLTFQIGSCFCPQPGSDCSPPTSASHVYRIYLLLRHAFLFESNSAEMMVFVENSRISWEKKHTELELCRHSAFSILMVMNLFFLKYGSNLF